MKIFSNAANSFSSRMKTTAIVEVAEREWTYYWLEELVQVVLFSFRVQDFLIWSVHPLVQERIALKDLRPIIDFQGYLDLLKSLLWILHSIRRQFSNFHQWITIVYLFLFNNIRIRFYKENVRCDEREFIGKRDILGIDEKSSTSISGQIRSSSTRKSRWIDLIFTSKFFLPPDIESFNEESQTISG